MAIKLTWQDVNEQEIGHRIYRSENRIDFTGLTGEALRSEMNALRIADIGANITEYIDHTAEAGKTYYYRISAYSQMKEAVSTEVEVVGVILVRFLDHTGAVITEHEIAHGDSVTPPADPVRAGFDFMGWNPSTGFTNLTSDQDFTPVFDEIIFHNVTFIWGHDGSQSGVVSVQAGETATAPSIAAVEAAMPRGWTFTGWSQPFSNIQSSITVTALYQHPTTWGGMPVIVDEATGEALIPAPPELRKVLPWGLFGTDTTLPNVITGIDGNQGSSNTDILVSSTYSSVTDFNGHIGSPAAAYTRSLNSGTAYPYFLPTTNDLLLTYLGRQNLIDAEASYPPSQEGRMTDIINGASDETNGYNGLWSSTERSATDSWAHDFKQGERGEFPKGAGKWVVPMMRIPLDELSEPFEVQFRNHAGVLIGRQFVQEGFDAVPPEAPERAGYEFTGWSGTYTNVTSNRTITAQYKEIQTGPPSAGLITGDGLLDLWYTEQVNGHNLTGCTPHGINIASAPVLSSDPSAAHNQTVGGVPYAIGVRLVNGDILAGQQGGQWIAVAPANRRQMINWGFYNVTTGVTSASDGAANTNNLIGRCAQDGGGYIHNPSTYPTIQGSPAANFARLQGYNLPSEQQLQVIYNNRTAIDNGDAVKTGATLTTIATSGATPTTSVWSSTEASSANARSLYFFTGSWFSLTKSYSLWVVPARSINS